MILKDLNKLALEAQKKNDQYDESEFVLSDHFKEKFNKTFPTYGIEFAEFTAVVTTKAGNLKIIIPNQWFAIGSLFSEFVAALKEYKKNAEELGINKSLATEFRKKKIIDSATEKKIIAHFPSREDQLNFIKFLTDYSWWAGSKTVERSDYFVSPVLNLARVVNVTQTYIANLAYVFSDHRELVELIQNDLNNYFEEKRNYEVSTPTKKVELDNLKEKFADWLILRNLHRANYFSTAFGSNRTRLIEYLTKYEEIYLEEFNSSIFSSSLELKDFILELENNLYQDSGKFFSVSEKASNHMPRAILGKNNYLKFLKELLIETKISSANSPKVNPENKIYFGAPGTGKSFRITQDLKEVDTIFQKRITFHPEYDNTSFVGGYKPITDKNGEVKYEFVPQIFTNIYVEACNDPVHQYYLIIEEINRGNCAEIFGELFQLLDRDENYKITPSDELINYLNDNITNSKFYLDGDMLLPDNLSILATMNTSDQSLFPMDSAFKRRWEWEYIPICYGPTNDSGESNVSNDFIIDIKNGQEYSWIEFIKKINLNHIKDNPSLGMDKCIGNYFIKPINGKTISLKTFINKVIFYLWNDVFKDENNKVFEEKTSYEDFFPIETNGKKKIKELFERIDLNPNKSKPLEIVEEETPLGQVAEDEEEIGS